MRTKDRLQERGRWLSEAIKDAGPGRMLAAGGGGAIVGSGAAILLTLVVGVDRVKSNAGPFLEFPVNFMLLLGWFLGGTLAGLRTREGLAKALTEGVAAALWALGMIVFFSHIGIYRPDLHVGGKNLLQTGFLMTVVGSLTAILVADYLFDRQEAQAPSSGRKVATRRYAGRPKRRLKRRKPL